MEYRALLPGDGSSFIAAFCRLVNLIAFISVGDQGP